jgi:hypothetical protein
MRAEIIINSRGYWLQPRVVNHQKWKIMFPNFLYSTNDSLEKKRIFLLLSMESAINNNGYEILILKQFIFDFYHGKVIKDY